MANYYDLCLECGKIITNQVNNYSIKEFGIPLCINCQKWIKEKSNTTTLFTLRLYFDLKMRGIPAELEKYDGYKHIDIVVECAKIHIEIDGAHHNLDAKQALADLKRTYHSLRNGYYTIRIPNCLTVESVSLLNTANYIADIINVRMDDLQNNNMVHFKIPNQKRRNW